MRLRKVCYCGCPEGYITETGAQDVVRCLDCDKYLYNAPRSETGKDVRSVETTRAGIKPRKRSRIIERATGRCELCGRRPDSGELHVGHLISVKDGLANGLSDDEINDDSNLCCMCDSCNLGIGSQTVPLRLAVAMVMARLRSQR
jgi:hypothetical protein